MAIAATQTLNLNNDVTMPALGFGVFQTPPEETAVSVEAALRVGYRLIDTAAAYGNEREVGEGIRRSGIDRDDVFVETKVWISDYGYDATLHAFDKSARRLGVDQLDLLILHQPLPSRFDLALDAYRALEALLAQGKVRAIGLSNFMPEHLDRLLTETSVVPAVNQIEVHPYFHRIAENFDVFDFELTTEQVAAVDALDTGVRGGPEPESITLEDSVGTSPKRERHSECLHGCVHPSHPARR
jgi:diketogulonate reductase-like aldo/keto reductase